MKTVGAGLVVAAALLLAGCNGDEAPPKAPLPPPVPAAPPGPEAIDRAKTPALVGHMNRGLDFLERYDYAGAAASFRKAAELVPGFYPAQFDYAISLVNDQKDPAAAEKALRAAAALAPKEAAPRYMLGILLTQGVSPPRTKEAEEEFRAASALAPEDADCHHRLAMTLKEQDHLQEAEKEFSAAVDLNPYLGAALYQRGINRFQIGREAEAKTDLEKFQVMDRAKSVDSREISYGFMGPLGNAVRDLDRWLPPAPEVEGAAVRFVEVEGALEDATDPGGTIAVADLDGDGLQDLVFGGKSAGLPWNLGGSEVR